MKYFLHLLFVGILSHSYGLFPQLPEFRALIAPPFRTKEQDYLENIKNLSSIVELNDFFDTQCSIYIDNVYTVYQKFCYKLLGDLPKSRRWRQIKLLTQEMDAFLDIEVDLSGKTQAFDQFVTEHLYNFSAIFEYDADETLLTAAEFHDIYVQNKVEDVWNYANEQQMREFVDTTGDGIRLFLILNRPYLQKARLLEFKSVVDAFLEEVEFVDKRTNLELFLQKAIVYLS